ncbi:restriction endonuclease subunit S [Prevotella sp.]|uniref:restriction endonuclease subunit S n=1 Tax=Prevotella sp. TaxID=59823 RepID=UPI0025DBD5B3|nr:restriction endonuclease subunit S [Prevotella sp.]
MKQGWEYKKLNEVCEKGSSNIVISKLTDNDGDYPLYGASGLVKHIDFYHQDKPYIGIVKDGAGVGRVNIYPAYSSLVGTMQYIFPKKDCLLNFIKYFLVKLDLSHCVSGATIPHIYFKDYGKDLIPVPSLKIQEKIVSELDKINELIRLKKEQLKDYDNLAQSIFYEMFGDPVENEKGWEVKKLGEVCITITDGDHMPPPKSESGIPFLTISDINKETRELDFSNTYFVPIEYYNNLKEERKAKLNDLLYTVTGSYGIPVIVKDERQFCFQRHIALIRPQKEVLSTYFLCYWVLSAAVKSIADKVATGIAQKTVGLNSIRKFEIIIPPLPLQHLFAQRIEQIERQKSAVQKSITDLETLLASRMQYWFE